LFLLVLVLLGWVAAQKKTKTKRPHTLLLLLLFFRFKSIGLLGARPTDTTRDHLLSFELKPKPTKPTKPTTTMAGLARLVVWLALVATSAMMVAVVEADKKLTSEQQGNLLTLPFIANYTGTLNFTSSNWAAKNVSVERWLEIRSAIVTSKENRKNPTLTVRKEVREMTCKEWDAYTSAIQKLYKSEHWSKYTRVHENERQLIWDLSHSDARQKLFTFLPWHRLWLRGIERELQKIDPNVAIPYWNWALDSANPLGSAVLSEHYFGGNGDPERGNCVMDGAFASVNEGSNETQCIKRFLPEEAGGFLTLTNIKDILVGCEDFDSFNLCVENGPGLYGYMHMLMGGDEAQNSNDPLFLSMYSFADMLWWRWQRMHDGMNNPALSFRGNRKETLLPFEENVEDVFSVEEMGYTYYDPLEETFKPGQDKPCYTAEKGGDIDIALLGHQVFEKLPNNITELVKIPRKTSLLNVEMWKQWMQLKLQHHQVPTAVELEGDLKMWAHLASWPSFNNSNWNSQEDYGLGVPLSMIMPEFFLQQELSGAANKSSNYCDYLSMSEMEDPSCIVQRPKTKWYLNTFHQCTKDKINEIRQTKSEEEGQASSQADQDFEATDFNYLSFDDNVDTIDTKVLDEAEEILTAILYDVIDPIVKYEDERYLVQTQEGETVEVEGVENPNAEEEEEESREAGIAAEPTPTDEGEKLYNLADDFETAVQSDPAIQAKPQDYKTQAYLNALKRVKKIFDRAYYYQAMRLGY